MSNKSHYLFTAPASQLIWQIISGKPPPYKQCRVYWGSHGCHKQRGHKNHCVCDPCRWGPFHWLGKLLRLHPYCVERWPYYGRETRFYGKDVTARGLPELKQ